MNAKQAAIRTGYSEKSAESQSSRLLRNDKVKKTGRWITGSLLQRKHHDGSAGRVWVNTELPWGSQMKNTSLSKVQGKDVPEARIIDKPPDEKSRLKALELMAKRHRILSGDTTIDIKPVLIVGGDDIAWANRAELAWYRGQRGIRCFWRFKGRYKVVKGSRASKKSSTQSLKVIMEIMENPC